MELIRANQHIEMLSALTQQQPRRFGEGMLPNMISLPAPKNDPSASPFVSTQRKAVEGTSSASNLQQRKQAVETEHLAVVKEEMMREQAQMRAELQDSYFANDALKSELFQKQLENDDLR